MITVIEIAYLLGLLTQLGRPKIILKRETQKDQDDQILSIVECCC